MKTHSSSQVNSNFNQFLGNAKKVGKSVWNGFLVTSHVIYESGAFAGAFIIAGIVCALLYPKLAPPLLCLGVALIGTIIVVKILDQYDIKIINVIKEKACNISTKYAKLHLITFLFAIGISFLSPIAGGIVGGIIGIASGLVIHLERVKRLRKIHAENLRKPKQGVKENFVFV